MIHITSIDSEPSSLVSCARRGPYKGKTTSPNRFGFLWPLLVGCVLALPAIGQECLRIRVVDPSGEPVPSATVTIGAVNQPTDDAGVAIFCGLGNGPHAVTVSAPNLQTVAQTVDQSVGSVMIELGLEIVSTEVVVVGTRSGGRDPLASPVPVELVPGERLRNSGHVETGRALQMLAPSFNFPSSAITDGTDSVRPATLRGLGPDQVLVLVNGKRRHNSALLHVLDSVGRGTAGTDMNAIPIGAIERIEVLRDGGLGPVRVRRHRWRHQSGPEEQPRIQHGHQLGADLPRGRRCVHP